ncbi:MAG: patatin-like phospholipase family protein, partial [Paracoccaceae bacterium]
RAIDFVQRLLEDGTMTSDRMSRVFVHMIADDDLMNDLSVATKVVPNAALILQMKAAGRAAAHNFLDHHFDDLNQRSSVDLRAMFQ